MFDCQKLMSWRLMLWGLHFHLPKTLWHVWVIHSLENIWLSLFLHLISQNSSNLQEGGNNFPPIPVVYLSHQSYRQHSRSIHLTNRVKWNALNLKCQSIEYWRHLCMQRYMQRATLSPFVILLQVSLSTESWRIGRNRTPIMQNMFWFFF